MTTSDEASTGTGNEAALLLKQARALFEQRAFDESEKIFRNVIDSGTNVAEGYYGVGVVRLRLNDLATAENYLRQALEYDPHHANAL